MNAAIRTRSRRRARAPRERDAPVVVSARDLARRYGEGDTAVDALRGVSLDVARGELTR